MLLVLLAASAAAVAIPENAQEAMQAVPALLPQYDERCMECVCRAMNPKDECSTDVKCSSWEAHGPYCIMKPYWLDAGKPLLPGDNATLPGAFKRCVKEELCAKRTVRGYMKLPPKLKDCDHNGEINCRDLLLTHMYGRYNCVDKRNDKVDRLEWCLNSTEPQLESHSSITNYPSMIIETFEKSPASGRIDASSQAPAPRPRPPPPPPPPPPLLLPAPLAPARLAPAQLALTPPAPAPLAPTPQAPTPLAPAPIAPAPLAPAPLAPAPLAPTPLAPTPAPLAPAPPAPAPPAPTPLAPAPLAPPAPPAPAPLAPAPLAPALLAPDIRVETTPLVMRSGDSEPVWLPALHRACLYCLCEAATACNAAYGCDKGYCGPFKISRIYWTEAGQMTLPGDDPERAGAYEDCARQYACSARLVIGYMEKLEKDCNKDGRLNCDDYALMHFNGGYSCDQPLNKSMAGRAYEERYLKCRPEDDDPDPLGRSLISGS